MTRAESYETRLAEIRVRQDRARPAGTPTQVQYPLGEVSLPAHVDHWAAVAPDRLAVVKDGESLTYAQLADAHARWAGWLQGHGVRPGDRVGIHLGNAPQFLVAMLGTLRAGAVHVPVNPMFQHAELVHELTDATPRVVLTASVLVERVARAAREAGVETLVVLGPDDAALPEVEGLEVVRWSEALASEPLSEAADDLDALAALNYTGGTTGMPKGCEHTQRHMIYTAASTAGASGLRADGSLVSLSFIPVFWIAGEDLAILIPFVMGGTSVLMDRWDPATVVDLIERYRVTTTAATVENYLDILALPGIEERDLSSLESPLAMSFVAKLTPGVRRRWAQVAGPTSVLREGAYGMTETHTCDVVPYGFADEDHDLLSEPVFCGLPVPGTDLLVVDPVSLEPLDVGERGEIIVRSPSVMTRYWRNPAATESQMVDGWLRTGDTGYLDELGCLHYLARTKDLIKVKGMSVLPAEVEGVLAEHPEVATVAVVPTPDPETGERPLAFVTLRDGGSVSAEDLVAWVTERISAYKVPDVHVLDVMPMTPTGKIHKADLARRARGEG